MVSRRGAGLPARRKCTLPITPVTFTGTRPPAEPAAGPQPDPHLDAARGAPGARLPARPRLEPWAGGAQVFAVGGRPVWGRVRPRSGRPKCRFWHAGVCGPRFHRAVPGVTSLLRARFCPRGVCSRSRRHGLRPRARERLPGSCASSQKARIDSHSRLGTRQPTHSCFLFFV